MCICSGSWDQRQNPDPYHGHPLRGWHAGYSPGVCQKLWQVTVHTHLCKYLPHVFYVIKWPHSHMDDLKATSAHDFYETKVYISCWCAFLFYFFTGRHIRRLQETPPEVLRWQRLKRKRCLLHYRHVIFYKYQFPASFICTIHKPQSCMPCQCSQCNVYLVLRILHMFFSVCSKGFIFFLLWYLGWIFELNIDGHSIDLLDNTYSILQLYIFKIFYFTCANISRYLMISGMFISYS